jgi:hypothetical protein
MSYYYYYYYIKTSFYETYTFISLSYISLSLISWKMVILLVFRIFTILVCSIMSCFWQIYYGIINYISSLQLLHGVCYLISGDGFVAVKISGRKIAKYFKFIHFHYNTLQYICLKITSKLVSFFYHPTYFFAGFTNLQKYLCLQFR